MSFTTNDTTIISSGIAFFLIGILVSLIGMIGLYHVFPDVIMPLPSCDCPTIHEGYERNRELFSMFGFGFGLIPMGFWQLKCRIEFKQKQENVK